jgi:uncharacterized membrane protein YccC
MIRGAQITSAEAGPREVIEEFARLLSVLSEQLADSLHESGRDCVAVGQRLAAASEQIDAIAARHPAIAGLREHCAEIGASLAAAVGALQYHDRLAQRAGHIRSGLEHLQALLRDRSERSYEDWLVLLRGVEQAQRAEQTRLMAAELERRGTVEIF